MYLKSWTKIVIVNMSIISLISCNVQQHMLYYPDSHLPSESQLTALGMQFWPSGPKDYKGFIGTAKISNIKGTVIVFHGNAGTAADREYYLRTMASMGYRVILSEYPGYGQRPGELGEKSFVQDAQSTIRLVAEKYGKPIFLLGESLGCGVVALAVKDISIPIKGVILITPWDTLQAVAKSHYPFLPVGLFMIDRYDSVENLKPYMGRVAVVGAERDEILPIKHAHALYESLTDKKKMWIIKGAGHNDWTMFLDKKKWQEFMDFVESD